MDLRTALADDIPAIERLIETSVRTLQAGDYTAVQREAALHKVFGVDRQLIADQTYFLIEEGQALIGCGGWSYRRTLFGADAIHGRDSTPLDAARRGVATRLLEACEAAATAAGFTRLELGATLTGVAFYARQGFVAGERLEAPLGDGERLAIVRMSKTLG
jgi:N-acetylglutamate synthase-like GNAT family acetyltransferase